MFLYQIYSFISAVPAIVWKVISVIGVVVGIIRVIMTYTHRSSDQKNELSSSSLQQIKNNFSKAIGLLSRGNNNIKWHQAIDLLKVSDGRLKLQLNDKSHKENYLLDFVDTAYQIISIVDEINDFKFFYGQKVYKEKDSKALFQQSNSMGRCARIDPESLLCLARFVDKAARCSFALNEQEISPDKIYEEEYFASSISASLVSSFTQEHGSMKVIMEYIKDYRGHESKQYQ